MTLEKLSPIALFVYNRPYHTKKTIEYLSKNVYAQNSDLFIFSDGAKNHNKNKIQEVRNYIKTIDGFKNIEILWASVREPYNYTQAKQLGCDIITIPPSTIEKIENFENLFRKITWLKVL